MKEAHRANTRSLLLSALVLSSSAFQAQAYYHPDEGRWLSRDPIGEIGFRGPLKHDFTNLTIFSPPPFGESQNISELSACYLFVGNNGIFIFDILGLFGDGGGLGHDDFDNTEACPFDFTLEDQGGTGPAVQPWRHFRDLAVSQTDVDAAVNSCSSVEFARAMHRGQDYFSHYAQGYRWAPYNPFLPCGGWGHICDIPGPDADVTAWDQANQWTAARLDQWHSKCCKKCASCDWVQRAQGPCDPLDVFP